MSQVLVSDHFLEQFEARALYGVGSADTARRLWMAADPLPADPFDVDGAASFRYYADAEAVMICDHPKLVTVLSPTQALERATLTNYD